MSTPTRTVTISIALAAIAFAAPYLGAQAPAPSGQTPAAQAPPPAVQTPAPPIQTSPAAAQTPAPIRGELVQVDSNAKTLTVMTAEGTKVQFLYTDKTEVSGAKEGIAGLASMKNAQVVVTFAEDAKAKSKTALRIAVQPNRAELQLKP
jgi:hypothetical protein